jgi:dienelactone hydrolase
MQRLSELVRVRAEDLEPGRRVRMPCTIVLSEVVGVRTTIEGMCVADTELGAYVCDPRCLVDTEDSEDV